jgi:hypothetical protein
LEHRDSSSLPGRAGIVGSRTPAVVTVPASDLYSLGVVGYECLTGAPPFRGPPLQVAEAHLRHPFPALPAAVPAEVAALVAALTAKDPWRRPGSAREVAERAGKLRTAGDPRTAGDLRAAVELRTPVGLPTAVELPTAVGLRTAGKITRPGAISPVPASGGPPVAACLTLPDIGAQARRAGLPAFGARPLTRQPRSAWKRVGAGLAVAAAMTAAGLAGWQASLTGAARPHAAARQPAPQAPPMVLVSSASLTGQQAGMVVAGLRRLGLQPRLAFGSALAQPPGTVLSVQPGGALPPGTVVTVTVAAQPAQHGGQLGEGGGGRGGTDGRGNGGTDGGNGGTDGGGNSGSGGGGNGD